MATNTKYGIVMTVIGCGLIMSGIGYAYALESNENYLIGSDSIVFEIEMGSDEKGELVNGGCNVGNDFQSFDTIKAWRSYNDGDSSRVLGKTLQGNTFYALYNITEEQTKLFCKVWHNGTSTRIVEFGVVQNEAPKINP